MRVSVFEKPMEWVVWPQKHTYECDLHGDPQLQSQLFSPVLITNLKVHMAKDLMYIQRLVQGVGLLPVVSWALGRGGGVSLSNRIGFLVCWIEAIFIMMKHIEFGLMCYTQEDHIYKVMYWLSNMILAAVGSVSRSPAAVTGAASPMSCKRQTLALKTR